MKKILFLGKGSKKDPDFRRACILGDFRMASDLENKGITVIDKVIESCHGCPDLMSSYSSQLQHLVEDGNRVVGVLSGGLLFALPSIQASQTTFPIISYPLDFVAYQAFIVPSGHAAIATVGVDKFMGAKHNQARKALDLAEMILGLERDEVNIISDTSEGKLSDRLKELSIKSCYGKGDDFQLSLAYGDDGIEKVNPRSFLVRAWDYEYLNSWVYLEKSEGKHHEEKYNIAPTVQVRGLENLAIFAAKIISLQRPEIRNNIRNIARDKRNSYERRDLLKESGVKSYKDY